ncbi:hypothetical protein GC173_01095 [bacterium]|nr:hypothetical protein [bacterium]
MIRNLLVIALVTAAAGATVPAHAQLAGGFAPPEALDTLNSGSVGDGAAFGGALDRARGAVAATQGSPFGASDPAANPFGAEGGGGFSSFGGNTPSPFGAGPSPFGLASGPIPLSPVAEAELSAWGGERIICHRTGQVLQDAREINIVVSKVGSYYDDGKQGNDAVAGDNIYTNITINRNYISPEVHLVKTRVIQTLQYASELSPMKFNLAEVATTEHTPDRAPGWRAAFNGLDNINIELVSSGVLRSGSADIEDAQRARLEAVGPNSVRFRAEQGSFGNPIRITYGQTALVLDGDDPGRYIRITRTSADPLTGSLSLYPLAAVPRMVDLETEQDKRLREWVDRRLHDYRTEPDNLRSAFFPTFLPPPPKAPNIPLPATFTDKALPEGAQTVAGVGGAGGAGGGPVVGDGGDPNGVTGEPIGAASSRYF